MIVTFRNIIVTIEAEDEKAAYLQLTQAMKELQTWESGTYEVEDGEALDTKYLF